MTTCFCWLRFNQACPIFGFSWVFTSAGGGLPLAQSPQHMGDSMIRRAIKSLLPGTA